MKTRIITVTYKSYWLVLGITCSEVFQLCNCDQISLFCTSTNLFTASNSRTWIRAMHFIKSSWRKYASLWTRTHDPSIRRLCTLTIELNYGLNPNENRIFFPFFSGDHFCWYQGLDVHFSVWIWELYILPYWYNSRTSITDYQ